MFHKKISNFINILLITGVLIAAALYMDEAASFNRFCVSEDRYENICQNRTKSKDLVINKLCFNENELFFIENTSTWYYSQVVDNKSAYNPKVNLLVNDENAKIAFKERITDDLISNNKCVSLLVYTDTEYNEYSIVCTTLPIVSIDYEGNTVISRDTDSNASITVFDNSKGVENRVYFSNVLIHLRGASSSYYSKKNYKLSLITEDSDGSVTKNKLSLLGMRADDDWILTSLYSDHEKVRQVFCTNLWYEYLSNDNQFGVHAGSTYKYVEVIENGKYVGIYALGYQPDAKQLGLTKNDDGYYNEYLYKKLVWESDDYLAQGNIDFINYYELRNECEDGNGMKTLISYYHTLYNASTAEEIYEVVDIDNMINFKIFNTFIQGVDNMSSTGMHNAMIALKQTGSGYVAMFVPWDLDVSLGNNWYLYAHLFILNYDIPTSLMTETYMNGVDYLYKLGDERIKDLFLGKYSEIRYSVLSEKSINAYIDEYEDIIFNSGAYLREMEAWPNGNYEDPSLKLSKFRAYVIEHLEKMDEYIYSNY